MILTIFGRNIAEEISNQVMLYFSTSFSYCFCTTWQDRKRGNYVFLLKCCMLLCQQAHKTHSNYHLVTAEAPFIRKTIGCMHQIKPRKGTQRATVCY